MGTQCGIGQTYSEAPVVTSATVTCTGECDCNIPASGVSGRISDGPGIYSRSSRCRWQIRSNVKPAEIIINIKPGSVFEMDGSDKIYVFDGSENVAYYSRTDIPSTLTTQTGDVTVTFYSDDSFEKEGFELEWFLQTRNACTLCSAAYDAGMLTDAFNNDRDHFGCIEFV